MKKQKLINALLAANIKPEDWPEEYGFAAQDGDGTIYVYTSKPEFCGHHYWPASFDDVEYKIIATAPLCKKWDKKVIARSEFVERYNDIQTRINRFIEVRKNVENKMHKLKDGGQEIEFDNKIKEHFHDQTYLKSLCPELHKEINDLKEQLKLLNDELMDAESAYAECQAGREVLTSRVDRAISLINCRTSFTSPSMRGNLLNTLTGKDGE
jgi:chaperonin cofactor prefoldin